MMKIINGLLLGIILGFSAAMVAGPGLIHWWYAPPAGSGGYSCAEPVAWAVSRYTAVLLGGGAVFGLFGAMIGIMLRKKKPAVVTASGPANTSGTAAP